MAKAEKSKTSKSAPVSKASGKASVKPAAKPAPKPSAPKASGSKSAEAKGGAATATGTTTEAIAGVVRKKKNVKRGAPPMLPRRNLKREIPPPGSPPPPPRAPMMPGSLHAPARAPDQYDAIKKHIAVIHNLVNQLKGMKRSLQRQFYEAGVILTKLSDPVLYKARNYASFDAFVEREIERETNIGRSEVGALVRIVKVFQRDAAEEIGFEKLRASLKVLYPETGDKPGT